MLRNFFKKSKDQRTINQLIFDVAEYNRAKDFEILYEMVKGVELYCPVDAESIRNIPSGEKYVTQKGDNIKMSSAKINGMEFILFYTSETDERLGDDYIKMDGLDALNMTSSSEGVSGMLIQNNASSWCAFDNKKIEWILSQ